MTSRKNDIGKEKRTPGRPPVGQPILVRLGPEIEGALDTWIREQIERPSRAEAIRQLLTRALRLR